jgi:glycerophosphoryl diester phosphodiesterase
MMTVTAKDWPYPRWVAHRGAGKLAPENTLAAFRLGAAHGFRMFECDAKLSADGVAFLLHDATLERTSNGQGTAGDKPWSELAQLDAGSWHSRSFAGEPLATLENLARFCLHNGYFLNIEIKPTPGAEYETGEAVANAAARLWQGAAVPPLLTSFQPRSLEAAQAVQPTLPRGLLLDQWLDGWQHTVRQLDCVAVDCKHTMWDEASVVACRSSGWRMLSYTVNDAPAVERLRLLGCDDAIITDRVDLFAPAGK